MCIRDSITGASVYYAGGGAGEAYILGVASGGNGGGGDSGASGTDGLGGGGGGGSTGGTRRSARAGGSGVVIISYISTTAKASGGTITSYTSGSDTYQVHTFTSSALPHTITATGAVNVRGADLDTTYTAIDAFTSTGADTWTCPTGVTSIAVSYTQLTLPTTPYV